MRSKFRRYAEGGDIQSKIDKLQALIDSPTTPETDKVNFRDALKKFKEKQKQEMAGKEPKPKTTAVAKPKPKTTAVAKPKPKGIQMISRKKFVIDGKEVSTDSKEFCDYLTAEFIKRKEKAKQNRTVRKKTKSVMAQVTDKIESGVQKAIKTGITKQKPALKKNPNVFIGKVQKLETATKNFLQQLKEVLGSEYDDKEIKQTTSAIQKMIDELKKKYSTKK